MDEQTAALNAGGSQPADRDKSGNNPIVQPRAGAMKFRHASGSRPLEGYQIKRGIGIGGFGEVYFATSDAGKEVALKHIQRNLDVELRGVSQCLNLKHPNLVTLYNIRYDDHDDGWVVMEYVSGVSLRDVIDAHPNGMPHDLIRSWLTGIAAGTAYLHDHGIVHRDLKPGNIFLDEGLVKIGDYGLSKFISVSRRSGQTESVGTLHYMAPEIGKGIYGKEIDVYALGVVLYEMLTGKVPFDGESSQEIIMKHLTDQPDLSRLTPVDSAVVKRALAKDPANRYSNVADLAAALELNIGTAKIVPASPEPVSTGEEASDQVHDQDMLYITDDASEPGIVFGPMEQIDSRGSVPPVAQNAARQRPQSSDEPIARAVRCGWQRTRDWWRNVNLYTPLKVLILTLAALLLLGNVGWLMPVTILSTFVYLGYLSLRAIVLERPGRAQPVSTALSAQGRSPRSVVTTSVSKRQNPYRNWQAYARQLLRTKPLGQRLAEVTGSMLMSALVAAVLGVVGLIVLSQDLTGSIMSWAPTYAWLTLSSVVGAWTVLIVSKYWEGHKADQALRRFTMLALGLIVGAASYGIGDLLLVHPAVDLGSESTALVAPSEAESSRQAKRELLAYLGYFSGLFLVFRFWKQADPLRSTRLSLWGTGACVAWAVILQYFIRDMFFHIPHGFTLAAIISITVQLAAPRLDDSERNRIRQEAQQAYIGS